MVVLFVPWRERPLAPARNEQALFDFRPVLRNRSAMAYALVYCIHTLEMNGLRGWAVAFLTYVGISAGAGSPPLSPTAVVTILGLIGTVASVLGNETAIRFGRRRLIFIAMAGSIVFGASIGFIGSTSYWLAAVMLPAYGFFVWLDSASLTAGSAGTAEPSRRGATLAVHSMLGCIGGFVGPLVIGFTLDAAGGMSRAAWGMAFLVVALLMLLALIVFRMMRPRELTGDRGAN